MRSARILFGRCTEALAELCDEFVLQKAQKGTGHAVLEAAPLLGKAGATTVLILNGDLPTLRTLTLRALVSRQRRSGARRARSDAKKPRPPSRKAARSH